MSVAMTGTYLRLNLHVLDSNVKLIRAAYRLIAADKRKGQATRTMRKAYYKRLIALHSEAAILYLNQFKR